MTEKLNGLFSLPVHMRPGMAAYVLHGTQPGDFLTAVLCNDLMEACHRADAINKEQLHAYAFFLYNYAPSACYGSAAKVKAWVAQDGLMGLRSAQAGGPVGEGEA